MLIAEPTKYGAGVAIFGDYWDLRDAHECIHHLCSRSPLTDNNNNLGDFALQFAYDLRHAYQGDRDKLTFGNDDYDRVVYRGVRILWPVFLFQIALLRWAAGFQPTSKEQQANLYRIEHCAESALIRHDAVVGDECLTIMNRFSGVPNNYSFHFVSQVCYQYLFSEGQGANRFCRLPSALRSLYVLSPEYTEFVSMASSAEHPLFTPEIPTRADTWPKFEW